MRQESEAQFGKWQAYLWPIYSHELKKFLPMLVIFFLISFNYNVLRVMKDTLVVTTNMKGSESIPFIKGCAMFPGAVLMTYIFTKLSNRFSREAVFYIMISIFLSFFLLFGTVLYPMRDSLHFCLPMLEGDERFLGFNAMCGNWTYTIFYAMSELWGSSILFVLFWGFANQMTSLKEAKRFYGPLGVGANFSGIIAGLLSYWLSGHVFNPNLPGSDAWEQTQSMLLALVLGSGILAMLMVRRMYRSHAVEEAPVDVKRHKLSFAESISFTCRSRYLLCIAVIVVVYNIVINLTEVFWKYEVFQLYPEKNAYNGYMNLVTAFIGVIATLCSLLIPGNGLRFKGWTWTAMITPIVLLAGSVLFFGSYFSMQYFYGGAAQLLPMVVLFGTLQNISSRGAKYSVFDATKEMAFVPLDDEVKLKGKAAIDGIGSRLGKSGGAYLQMGLFVALGGLVNSIPYIGMLILCMIAIWITAVKALGLQFDDVSEEKIVHA